MKYTGQSKDTAVPMLSGPGKGPITNADRIRSMSNEEMAAIICTGCPPGEKYYVCPTDGGDGCGDCWLEWLQSPVGGEEDD